MNSSISERITARNFVGPSVSRVAADIRLARPGSGGSSRWAASRIICSRPAFVIDLPAGPDQIQPSLMLALCISTPNTPNTNSFRPFDWCAQDSSCLCYAVLRQSIARSTHALVRLAWHCWLETEPLDHRQSATPLIKEKNFLVRHVSSRLSPARASLAPQRHRAHHSGRHSPVPGPGRPRRPRVASYSSIGIGRGSPDLPSGITGGPASHQ